MTQKQKVIWSPFGQACNEYARSGGYRIGNQNLLFKCPCKVLQVMVPNPRNPRDLSVWKLLEIVDCIFVAPYNYLPLIFPLRIHKP